MPSSKTPNVMEGVTTTVVPVTARRVPSRAAIGSGTSATGYAKVEAERERALTGLTTFKKFNPPTFDRKVVDPWVIETLINSMETLFEDLYTLEGDKVHQTTHCLEKTARVWWRVKWNRSPSLPSVSWKKFRGLMFSAYFLDSEKKRLRENFRKLR